MYLENEAAVLDCMLYQVSMRPCWPYDDDMVSDNLNWGDGTSSSFTSPAGTPHSVSHAWSTTGNKTLTLQALSDDHGRALGWTTARTIHINCYTCQADDDPSGDL